MFKKVTVMILTVALTNVLAVSAFAKTPAEKAARQTAQIKAAIQKLGTGEKAQVKLELKDHARLEGFISEAGEESFTVINPKNEGTSTVTYPQVGKIKGHNLSTGAKIAIGVGIAIAIAVAVLFATNEDEIQFP